MSNINEQKIVKTQGYMLGNTLLSSISDYFVDETHQKEFEEWKKVCTLRGKGCKD